VSEEMLEPGDRVLFFTDGITEEHLAGGELFGEARLIDLLEKVSRDGGPVQETVRRLSHKLKSARGEVTNDDATLFLVEWRGGTADHLAQIDA
jgi:phosphoserine phosphatase RsbU/P